MFILNNLTDNALQQLVLTGIPGVQVNMQLRFMPRVQRWFADFTYLDTVINGVALAASPNILRQWKNNIPFGIGCVRSDGLDPYTITDFSSGASSIYLLDSDEVAEVEAQFFP